jgi:hypothetical protein
LNSCIITRFSGNNYISDSVIRHLLWNREVLIRIPD